MAVGDAFLDCNSSSAFYSLVAINSIKFVIWNEELLRSFEMCL
jgi:hypothetical protein